MDMANVVSELILLILRDYKHQMDLSGVDVDIEQKVRHVTFIFNKPFSTDNSDVLYDILRREQDTINSYLGNQFEYFRVGASTKGYNKNYPKPDF